MSLLVVDIDGSIACHKARERSVGLDPGRGAGDAHKAYIARFVAPEKIINDKPVEGMQMLLRGLVNTYDIVYLTGRSEIARKATERWLSLHRFPEAPLVMRGEQDWREASLYKRDKLLDLLRNHQTIMALEDDPEVVEMMVELGVTVLQVHYQEVE